MKRMIGRFLGWSSPLLLLLFPGQALAGYCTTIGDCVQGNVADGRLLVFAAGAVAGVIVLLMGEGPFRPGTMQVSTLFGRGEPLTADELQAAVDDAKAGFEALQQQLREETASQLAAIDQFQRDYDRLWTRAVQATEDYMRDYPDIMIDTQNLWEAIADREWAGKVAEWVDTGIQAAMMGLDAYHMGAAGLKALEAAEAAAASTGRVARESEILAARSAAAEREAAAARAAADARSQRELSEAMDQEHAAYQARREADAQAQRELNEAMDREHQAYKDRQAAEQDADLDNAMDREIERLRHKRAVEMGEDAQRAADQARARADRLSREVETNRADIVQARVDAEAKVQHALDQGLIPPSADIRAMEEARIREWMEPINRAYGKVPGNTNNCYQCAAELDRQLAAQAAARPGMPVEPARPAAMDYSGGDFTHSYDPAKEKAFYDVLFPGTSRINVAGREAVEQMLHQPGSRGIVQINWVKGGGGHVFNAVNHNGEIIFADAQTGEIVRDFSNMTRWRFRQTN